MGTTFKVAQEVLFLKESDELLEHFATDYNVLLDLTKNCDLKKWELVTQKISFYKRSDKIS